MDDLKKFKSIFYEKYNKIGDSKFLKYLLNYCLSKIILIEKSSYCGIYPHIEMMKYHDMSMKIFRNEKYINKNYLTLAKIFRKVAHKIYRVLLEKNLVETNYQFLTDISLNKAA